MRKAANKNQVQPVCDLSMILLRNSDVTCESSVELFSFGELPQTILNRLYAFIIFCVNLLASSKQRYIFCTT